MNGTSKRSSFDMIAQGLSEALRYANGQTVAGAKTHRMSGVDVAEIRSQTGLSQRAFSRRIGVPAATLQNWEQGRRRPSGPARILLALIARHPALVEETLRALEAEAAPPAIHPPAKP